MGGVIVMPVGVIKSNGEATTILTASRVIQELQMALNDKFYM